MEIIDTLSNTFSEIGLVWNDSEQLHILLILVVPAAAWLIRKPLAIFVFKLLKMVSKGVGIILGDMFKESILPAIQVQIVVLGALIAHESIQLPDPYFGIMEKLLISISVAAVFVVINRSCQYIPQFFANRGRAPEQLSWTVQVSHFIVVFVGIASVFKVWGIDIGPVLTGMGLAGAAVALGAQDYLKNLLAGFNNAAERRFREGDWICVDGMIEGTVESVDLRSTLIRRFDKAPVHVPNSVLANKLLINFSRCEHRRIDWMISLTYATSIDILRTIRDRIEQYIDGNDLYVSPELATRYVRIFSLNDSSIDIRVVCFSQSNVTADYFAVKEDLALAIKAIVEEAGGNFAFPSRSVYMKTLPGEEPVGG